MINEKKLKDWLHEETEAEKRMLERFGNQQNSPGVAMAIGSHDAYAKVLDFIEGKFDD